MISWEFKKKKYKYKTGKTKLEIFLDFTEHA